MRKLLSLLAAVLIVAGCGHQSISHIKATGAEPTCHPRIPAGAGERIKATLCAEHKLLVTPPHDAATPQCADISNWNGIVDLRESVARGLRCVVIQTNDGAFRNPFFYLQVASANSAHMPWGVYTFVRGFSASYQVGVMLEMSSGRGRTLGAWADAEVGEAYANACPYVDDARSRGVGIVGVYSAPGIYAGGHCQGYLWPAEWSSAAPYPFGGYPASAIKLRQWCGGCTFAGIGGEVDRDEDRGLLELAHQAMLRVRLQADIRFRSAQRVVAIHNEVRDLEEAKHASGARKRHLEADRAYNLAVVHADDRLIAFWRSQLH